MPVRVPIKPEVLDWAARRSGRELDELVERFPGLKAWRSGDSAPTLKQLTKFARATRTAVGTLLLDSPPDVALPIPDLRTIRDAGVGEPSPDLLDTVYLCEQRQEWYRDFARSTGEPERSFVGSLTTAQKPTDAADRMREALGFDLATRAEFKRWDEALRGLIASAEEAGILVMVSGIVGSNTRRKLAVEEFRGFALIDPLAPLVFINGADTRAAQIFTLAHELAHVWLGQPAVSNAGLVERSEHSVERWCNEVAAELLVPLRSLKKHLERDEPLADSLSRLARRYKVSTLVILRRLFDADAITWDEYRAGFSRELERVQQLRPAAGGGDYYKSQPVRLSRRFARAVIADTLEGRTLYRDAFNLLGVRKASTFEGLGDRLGVT